MVDAGRVLFQVGIDRPSLDRSVNELERRLTTIGNIDLKVSTQAASAAVGQLNSLFANAQAPEIDIRVDTGQAQRSLLTLESAISGLKESRLKLTADISDGRSAIAFLDDQIKGLQGKKLVIQADATAAEAEVKNIESKLQSLNDERIKLSVDDAATAELLELDAQIARLNSKQVKLTTKVEGADTELARLDSQIDGIESKKIVIDADTNRARDQINRINETIKSLSGNNAQETLKDLQREYRKTGDAAKDASDGAGSFNSVIAGFAGGAAFAVVDRLVDAFGALTGKVTEFVAASIQANAELRNTENALTILLGSQDAAAESIQFLRDTSEATGQSFSALQQNYAGITAAAAEFGLPQESVNELFAETSRVLGIFGKSSAESGLAFNALTQIFAKGQVSLEELRQQLGEQLPVALSAAANGLKETGVLTQGTTSELLDLISTGLDAATFAEGFTAGLKQIEGEAPAAQQAIAGLENAVLQFQQNLGASLEPLETAFSETFAAIFNEVDPSALDPLTEAGNRLRDSLAENPELAERLGEALSNFVGSGAEAVAEILDRITQAISNPENVEAFANGIENAGQVLEQLVAGGIAAAEVLINIGSAYSSLVDEETVIQTLTLFVDILDRIAQVSGSVVDGLGSIKGGLDEITGLGPGLDQALANLNQFGPVAGTAKTALESLLGGGGQAAIAAPEIDTSQFVPQQDELDKAVRAARSSNEQIAADAARAAKASASERAKADKEAAKAFEEAQKEAIAQVDIARQNRIAAVRQDQVAGNITEEQADSQVSTIEADSIRDRIELREQEIAKVEEFASRNAIAEKDAAKQIRDAKQEIADLTLESVENEIKAQEDVAKLAKDKAEATAKAAKEAQQATLDQLDAQQRLNSLQAEQVNIQSNIASTALSDQSNLIGAQVSLEQSRLSLSRQNLDSKLSEAEAAEDVLAVEELRDRVLLNQRQSIQADFEARRKQLGIQEQQLQLDADRQRQLGLIAIAEAQIAVTRAQASGASADEVGELQSIVKAVEQRTAAEQSNVENRLRALSIQSDELGLAEELANQRANQERREQAIEAFRKQQKDLADEQLKTEKDLASATERRASAADSLVSALSGLEDVSGEDALGNLDQLEENLKSARRAGAISGQDASQLQRTIEQAQSFARSGDGFSIDEAFRFTQSNEDNAFVSGVLDAAGLGGVGSFLEAEQELKLADAQIDQLSEKLVDVKTAVEELPDNLPPTIQNLNISSSQPVSDAAEIAFNLAKEQARVKRERAGIS